MKTGTKFYLTAALTIVLVVASTVAALMGWLGVYAVLLVVMLPLAGLTGVLRAAMKTESNRCSHRSRSRL